MKRFNLEHEVFIKQEIPFFFGEGKESDNNLNGYSEKGYVLYTRVPEYLSFPTNNDFSNFRMRTAFENVGYRMNLEDYDSADSYISSRFGRSSRYKLRREKKRLEQCFNPTYKMWFGEIERSHFEFLYDELFRLLEKRSEEKNIIDNYYFALKDRYKELIFELLQQRKASIHVIYVDDDPIDICINFMKAKIIYQFIRTYDIAYSKFKPGYINLIKHLEWAKNEGFESIVFGSGNVEWKEKWCNDVYKYYKVVCYDSNSLKLRVKSFVFISTYKIKSIIRGTKFMDLYQKMFKKDNLKKLSEKVRFSLKSIENQEWESRALRPLNINEQETDFRRFLFNHMYDNKIMLQNVKVFNSASQDEYIVSLRGKENKLAIKKF